MTDKRKRPSDTDNAERVPGDAQVIPMHEVPEGENFLAHIVTGAAIAAMPRMEWLLKGRIPMKGLVALYAPPKSGKSVVACELAVAAALGEPFWQVPFSRRMTVLYIAAERSSDIGDRLKATLQRRAIPYPDTLHVYAREAGPLQVNNAAHLLGLVQVAQHLKPDLIIFDTFARMTLGIEENSSGDMGEAVEKFNAVIRAAGPQAAGIIVHHQGKDKSKGLRGSTALLGAVDAVWSVTREGSNYALELEAMNAGALPMPEHFTIEGELIAGHEDTTPVLVWQAFKDFANSRDKYLVEVLNEAGEKGLSKAELTDLYNGKHNASKSPATVYGWLTKLVQAKQVEQPAGPKSATRYYGKGFAPK
jgi:hypothetical protein